MPKRSGWSRESRQSRGYGASWDKLWLVILRRDNGLCQCDRCKGGTVRLTIATEMHHIKAKANGGDDDPSNLQAVSAGTGASEHLSGVLFTHLTGTKMLHVPYKGIAQGIADTISREVQVTYARAAGGHAAHPGRVAACAVARVVEGPDA